MYFFSIFFIVLCVLFWDLNISLVPFVKKKLSRFGIEFSSKSLKINKIHSNEPKRCFIIWRECKEMYFLEQDLLTYNIPFTYINVDNYIYTEKLKGNNIETNTNIKNNTLTKSLPLVLVNGTIVGNSWFDIYTILFKHV